MQICAPPSGPVTEPCIHIISGEITLWIENCKSLKKEVSIY